ncbi:helix-hairpin-helix domain-containing protein [Streptomyces spirodelae]|uniref:ATP-binding domain-containing protein n=1 Tax=Streptomyces spirodelae TaxID=2812904 RepID=A0ABS3WRC6_9ACTN|nr:helix-hairpin-helix domain-containing protein [Streptomyces spirodelae]MBO8185667.1 ATP-binding domain-containing protein [Streptomyces spirodelae]
MSNDKAAELLAAVRAVESGERSAASFFNEPAPAERARAGHGQATGPGREQPRRAAAPPRQGADAASGRPGTGGPTGGGERPVAVPDEIRALLAQGGAPDSLARPVAETFGEGAAELLRADPWQLLALPGVRPEQADGFARALLDGEAGPGDPRRAVALAGHLLERAALRGDTVLAPGALAKGLAQHAVPDPEQAVREAMDAGAVLVFEDALDAGPSASAAARSAAGGETDEEGEEERPVNVLVGLDRYALAEESLADGLARIAGTFGSGSAEAVAEGSTAGRATPGGTAAEGTAAEGAAAEGTTAEGTTAEGPAGGWAAAAGDAPSPSARELIRAVAGNGLVTHAGGDASRAEIAALAAAARGLGLRSWVLTHTDDGSARMAHLLAEQPAFGPYGAGDAAAEHPADEAEASSRPDAAPDPGCATVAGLLAGTEGPGRDEEGALAVDLLAVCDAPQLDAETAAALLESLPDGVRLVLSGDPGVLGAAGPGQVFRDLMAAKFCPHIASRTPDPGPVGELVSGIGIGELNQVEAPGKEVVIVPVTDPSEAVHRTVQLVADSVPRALSVPSAETQVITPGHGGSAGTRALNAALKERLNPGPGRFGGFDPGDRVAYSPAPGRTTICTVASADDRGLHLTHGEGGLTVPPERVPETVRHGWAVTAHQAAGIRWPAAVVVLPGDATGALSREWVYTAFSRGERHLSVVHGAGDALPRAVASVVGRERTTRLRTLLTESARAAEAARAAESGGQDGEGGQAP